MLSYGALRIGGDTYGHLPKCCRPILRGSSLPYLPETSTGLVQLGVNPFALAVAWEGFQDPSSRNLSPSTASTPLLPAGLSGARLFSIKPEEPFRHPGHCLATRRVFPPHWGAYDLAD